MKKSVSKERLAGALLFVLVAAAAISIAAETLFEMRGGGFLGPATPPPPPLQAGVDAPKFELASLEGETVSLSQFKGSPVLLMFWGSS